MIEQTEAIGRWKRQEQELRDMQADEYDSHVSDAVVQAEAGALARAAQLERSHRLLDLGCGTGRTTLRFAGRVRTVVGADFSLASLRVFARRIPAHLRERVYLVQADAFQLPFRDESFDRGVSNELLEHLPGLETDRGPIEEVARVLRPGGIFACAIYGYSNVRRMAARLLPALTYGEGYAKEGFHAGRIYYRRYRWHEAKRLLEGIFEVRRVSGLQSVPKALLRRGGAPAQLLERALQRIPVSRVLGYCILVSGRKLP